MAGYLTRFAERASRIGEQFELFADRASSGETPTVIALTNTVSAVIKF